MIPEDVPRKDPQSSSEARLRAVISAIPDQYFWVRGDGTYLELVDNGVPSPLDSRTIVGTRVQDAPLPEEVKLLILGGISRAIATDSLQMVEYQLPVDGELRDREARMARCDEDEVLVLVRDITARKRAEAEIRRVNAVQSLILENSAIGIAFIRNRVFEWANPRVGELLGLGLAQLQGASTRVIFPDEASFEALGEQLYPRMAAGERPETVFQLSRSDGSRFWCRFVGAALDPAKVHEGSIWLFEDITERKRAEDRIQESHHFLRVLLDAIPSPVFYKGADLRYQGCNRAMETFLGLSQEELAGRTAFDIAPPALAKVYEEADEALLASRGTQVYQARVKAADGEAREVVFHKAVYQDVAGQVAGMVGVILDITERERASRELADTKLLLEAILEQSPTPILVVDAPDSRVRVCNRAARECLGILDEPRQLGLSLDSVRRTWREIDRGGEPVPPGELPISRALQGQETSAQEYRILRKDGSERICLAFGVPVLDREGRLLAGMAIFPDITERRRSEEALRRAQKLESLGLMAGGIAHDFNNLFQALETVLERARMRGEPGLLDKALGILDRAAALSSKMLEYSGKSLRKPEAVDLAELCREAAETLPRLVPGAPGVVQSLAPGLPRVEGDRGQLLRSLLAILVNAAEATPTGGGEIALTACLPSSLPEAAGLTFLMEPPRGEPRVCIRIQDQGGGIPPGHLGRIFDPFFTTKESGRGLGLSAALGLLRGHGAGLRVSSEPGAGALFQICLTKLAEEAAARPVPVQTGPHGRTVLLVDDEDELRELLGEVVRDLMGLPLLEARDGAEALEVFRAHTEEIGFVVMDATMPRMSGFESFQAMRRIRPDLRGILCSGYSEAFGEKTVRDFGFEAFLKKPFSIRVLMDHIERALAE